MSLCGKNEKKMFSNKLETEWNETAMLYFTTGQQFLTREVRSLYTFENSPLKIRGPGRSTANISRVLGTVGAGIAQSV
jgi:hypothetical protein